MKIPVYFEKLSMYERQGEPCTVALPFGKGVLKPVSHVSIFDGAVPAPSQSRVTSLWPDGSVKWLLVHFLADLPANQSKTFEFCTESTTVVPEKPVEVRKGTGGCVIDTGAIQVELNGPGSKGLFKSIQSKGGYRLDAFNGPTIQDEASTIYTCEIGTDGWSVLESGPVRVVVQASGKHTTQENQQWFDYVVRIYAFAGKPWLRVDYQVINRESSKEQTIHSLELQINGKAETGAVAKDVRTGLGVSNYATTISRGLLGERLTHKITAEQLKCEGNEHFPEVFYGTFWGDWCQQGTGGFSVTQYQAQQNFPKLLDVSDKGMTVGIVPEGTGLTLLQGMAKTHRLYVHIHDPDESLEQINIQSLQFQLPDRAIIDSVIYEQAGVMEPLHVSHKDSEVEGAFAILADYRARAYGILHWGDGPDPGYTEQNRGNGDWIWTNNEYDLPHSAMHIYARKGERRFLDYMLAAAEHWIDVDVCHYSEDPLRYQGQLIHSVNHAAGNPSVCHEWVEGLLDYYHMTGERSALEAALGIGDNVLRHLATPRYQAAGGIHARESGWALRSLGALYKETHDDKWLGPAEHIVDQFVAWKKKYGAWLAPYTDHTVVRVPFMIGIAVNSLMRYYQIRPQERIRDMIVDAVQDLLDYTYLRDEKVFIYKELPSLIRTATINPTILESLAYAYEFTGDPKFLEAGKVSFHSLIQRIVREGKVGGGEKEVSGDAVILWQGPGPKIFSQYYYPLFYYYRTTVGAGIDL